MKTSIWVLLFSILLFGCGGATRKMNKTLDNVYVGMPLSEFKQKVRHSTLVHMENNYSVYQVSISRAKFGAQGGFVYANRYFYFDKNKLFAIDEGTTAPDIKVEIDKTNN